MTERLYLNDSGLTEFEATVVDVETRAEGVAVELDRTAFYAQAGGQPSDRGVIAATAVQEIQTDGDRILHLVTETSLRSGDKVSARIDWRRRFDHMQQHTGQHVLSQAFVKSLEAATVSFHLGRESSTIDLEVDSLEAESIYAAEDLANSIVFEDRPVTVHEVDSSRQDRFPIRRPSQRQGLIRIVEVGDFDWSPCGGTHCRRSGEIGLIKVCRWEPHRGRARVEFVCGGRALADYRRKNRTVYQLTKLLSAPGQDLVEAARRQADKLDDTERQKRVLSRRLISAEARRLASAATGVGDASLVQSEFETDFILPLRDLALEIVNGGHNRIVVFGLRQTQPRMLLARSSELAGLDLRPVLKEAATCIGGRGGGSPELVQAGGDDLDGLQQALDRARKLIQDQLTVRSGKDSETP